MVLLGRRLGPRIWLAGSLVAWGALSMGHAGITSSNHLVALRLLLGAAEAGFTQTSFYYMSLMYPKFSLGLRMGLFSGMYSVAGAFAGLIAYGLMRVKSDLLHGWQIVFLVEGGFTILIGVIGFFVLPSDISTAWFLNEKERRHAVARMGRDLAGGQEEELDGQSRWVELKKDLWDVVRDWKKLLSIVCNIFAVVVSPPLPLPSPSATLLTNRFNSPLPPLPPSSPSSSRPAWATRVSRLRSCLCRPLSPAQWVSSSSSTRRTTSTTAPCTPSSA